MFIQCVCRHEEALVQYQKAREVFLGLYGQEHLLIAAGCQNTGTVLNLMGMGKSEEALEMFSKALEIRISIMYVYYASLFRFLAVLYIV